MRYVMWCTSVSGVDFMIHIKRCNENNFQGLRVHHKMCSLCFAGQSRIFNELFHERAL